jgi:hypothetical protein
VRAEEESWLASGIFESTQGSGESPGAEEWVVTPFGVVRYGAAGLSVEVSAKEARVAVVTGQAFLWTPADASLRGGKPSNKTDDGWQRADPGAFVLAGTGATGARPLSEDGARAAAQACSTLGKSAHDLGAILLAGGADAGTVLAQVTTRRLARAACAVAALRLGALPTTASTASTASIGTLLTEGNAGWSTLPDGPPSAP